jgi:hypothetical protein
LTSCLDAIAAFDDICFEADGSRPAVKLQEEPAGIAKNGTRLITTPEWSRACGTILANGLRLMPNAIVRRIRLKIVMEMYHIGDRDKDKGTEISSRP